MLDTARDRTLMLAVAFSLALTLGIDAASARGLQPCSLTGNASFSPFHPVASTVIGYSIGLVAWDPVANPDHVAVVKLSQPSSQRIELDLILTKDLAPFPAYTAVEFGEGRRSVHGTLGPLPVGEYVVGTRVRVFDSIAGTLTPLCSDASYDSGLVVYAQPPATAPVIEFYHARFDHYFITQNADEIRDLDTGVHSGWKRTGETFNAYMPGATSFHVGGIARFYGLPTAGLDSHVYVLAVSAEYFNLLWGELSSAWRIESQSAFELQSPDATTGACPDDTIPVYRLWNNRPDSNHRYTTDPIIKSEMVARGWVPEGYGNDAVFFCALGSG
jgi:hypothetical protein